MSAAVAALLSLLPADPPAPPTAADIAAMVRRLGADDSAVREKAQADLWAAGPAAEPAVRAATRGPDPEVARRAWLVRAKFDAGLFPDTPPDVAERIIGYRDGDAAARAATVAALADRGPAGAVAALRLARTEPDLALRHKLVGDLDRLVPKLAPALAGGRRDADLAALLALTEVYHANVEIGRRQHPRDRPWQEMAHWEAARALADGDPDAARAVAADPATPRAVRGQVLFHLADWPALAREGFGYEAVAAFGYSVHLPAGQRPEAERLGYRAAFRPLAGDADGHRAAVTDLVKWAGGKPAGEAVKAAKALLVNDRPDEAAEVLRAAGHHQAFDLLAARGEYRAALALPPGGPDRWTDPGLRRAEVLDRLGLRAEATAEFEAAARRAWADPERRGVGPLIEALRRAGRADEARTHAVRLLTAPPLVYGPDGLWYAVPALPTAAGPVLRAWRRWNPDAPWAEGVRLVTRGAVSRPLDPAFAGLVEDVLRTEWGRPERVYWPSAFGELARVCDRGGAADLARRCHLARHLPFDGHTGYSDDGRAGLWEAGDVFARRGRWAEAADLYAAAFRETGSPIAGYLVGDALARTGRGEGGRGLMRWAARVGPESILEGGGELARRAARAGDPDEADRLCRAFAAHGRRAEWGPQEGFYVRAELAAGRGDYALAAEAAEQARAYTLTDGFELGEPSRRLADAARIRRHRALGLLAAGDVAAAVREAEEALRLLPGDLDTPLAVVPALDKLGRAAEADGLYRRAADAHRRVLADFPAAAGHHAALARLAAGCHRELDNGLSHGRKAVELTPDDPAAVAALAEVLFARREVDEAAELARRCIDLDPADDAHRDRLVRFLGGHPVR